MQITKRIRLDFARALSPIYVFAKQGDVDSRYVEVEPLENGKAYTIPAGVTAAFACRKPDGHQVLIDGATSESGYPKIDYENNLIILELTDQTLAAAGDAIATAILKDSITNKVLSTQNFILKIERSALDGGSVESSNEYQGYISALNLIDEASKKSEDTVKEEEKRAESELERQLNEETRQEAEKERVETFAGWKEQIDGITADNAENRQNIAEMMPQITSNTQGITQNSQLISRNSARLTNVEQRISPSPFVTDSTVAYVKDVPANALPYAELKKLGGMTYRVNIGTDEEPNYVLRSAPVSSVESVGANLFSENILLNKNYAWISAYDDYIAIANGSRKFDMGIAFKDNTQYTLTYVARNSGGGRLKFIYTDGSSSEKYFSSETYITISFTSTFGKTVQDIGTLYGESGYLFIQKDSIMLNEGSTALPYAPYTKSTLPIPEAVQDLDGYGEGNPDDPTEYNSIQWDKKGNCSYSHKGNIVNNEWVPLSNEIVTDISALITADNLIPVQGNGTITFVNEYGYAVPSTVEYMT